MLIDNKPQYLVIWQIEFGLHVSLNIATILAVLKLVVTPTNLYPIEIISDYDIVFISQVVKFHHGGYFAMFYIRYTKPTLQLSFIKRLLNSSGNF